MKKFIVFIIVIIIVFWAYGRLTNNEDQPVEEQVTNFLEDLRKDVDLSFSEIKSAKFDWQSEIDGETKTTSIIGQGVAATGVVITKDSEIKEFFEKSGFVIDLNNIADGTTGGLIGYKKDSIVCVVLDSTSSSEDTVENIANLHDLQIGCGEFDGSINTKTNIGDAVE